MKPSQKSSPYLGVKVQSELEQPSELRREPEKDISSVNGSAMMGTGVRSDSAPVGSACMEADEDPGANLFPVRVGQSGPLTSIYKWFSHGASPVITFPYVRDVFLAALMERERIAQIKFTNSTWGLLKSNQSRVALHSSRDEKANYSAFSAGDSRRTRD